MSTFILLAVLVVLLIWVLMQLSKKSKTERPTTPPGPDLANLKVNDAREGDVISITGVGDNFTDLDFTADRYTRFDAGAHPWVELGGSYHERRVALRVAGDEELELAVHNDPRKLTLEDLGLSEEDLAQMDERQNTGDSFEFDGAVFLYRRSREVKASRDGRPSGAFYSWEFQEERGKRLLAVRKVEGEPFGVTLYTGIPEGDVTVYRGK